MELNYTKKVILGVPCKVEEELGVVLAEDISIDIRGLNDKEQSFGFYNTDLEKFSDFFEKYNCVTLGFGSFDDSPSIFNIDSIRFPERIRKLRFSLEAPTKVIYSGKDNPFTNLQHLSIVFSDFGSGNFPDLHDMSRLRYLEVADEKEFRHRWIDLKQITDLLVLGFGDADLSSLKGLSSLKRLRLAGGKIRNLGGIECLPSLETLFIDSGRRLVDAEAILKSKTLKNVMFERHVKIQDWEFLKNKKDLRCISLDVAASIDFMKKLPQLEFFFCKKVQDRKNKSFLFSTKLHQDKMTWDGIQVTNHPVCDEFYQPLEGEL